MQEKKTERAPGSYEDFVAYLGTVRTEEELFSPLTYWFVGQNCPEDVCFRPQLVEARAKELGFWQGLTFKVEHWMTTSRAEAEAAGAAVLKYGSFLSQVLDFLIVSFVIFIFVKKIMALGRKKEAPVEEAPKTKVCPYCKSEIAIDATRCPHCTSELP